LVRSGAAPRLARLEVVDPLPAEFLAKNSAKLLKFSKNCRSTHVNFACEFSGISIDNFKG
jgi:hypothetical protein